MTPQQKAEQDQAEERRVIPLKARTAARHGAPAQIPGDMAAPEESESTTRDWVAWLCLGLGIVCGAGALYYFAMFALL